MMTIEFTETEIKELINDLSTEIFASELSEEKENTERNERFEKIIEKLKTAQQLN